MGTLLSLVFGGLDLLFKILLLFMALDYLTGFMKGVTNQKLSSIIGWRGLMKKIGTLIAIIIAHQMDQISNTQVFRVTIMTFFVANEGISVVENLNALGVPIPKFMSSTLKIWKDEKGTDHVNH